MVLSIITTFTACDLFRDSRNLVVVHCILVKSITAENNTQTDNLFKAYFGHLKMLDFVVYNSQPEILYCYLHGLINYVLFSQHLHLETKHLSLYYYRNCVSSIRILVICIPQRQASNPFSAKVKD